MKATFISRENNNVKFTMEFTAEEFENAQIKAYQASKDQFQIDGFRKGKAPRSIIEKHYGEGIFFEEAIDELFRENYGEALKELDLEVIDAPAAEFSKIAKGEGFTITITVPCFPIVEVKDYKGVEIEKVTQEVKDEDIDNRDSYRMSLFGNANGAVIEDVTFSGVTFVVDAGKSTIQTVIVSPIAVKAEESVFRNVTFEGEYMINKLPSNIDEDSDRFIVVSGSNAYYMALGDENVTEGVNCEFVEYADEPAV